MGHVITSERVKPDPKKIIEVTKYPVPKNAREIKSFLGFAGYYRRFIANFSEIAKPLTQLLKKDVIFNWDAFCDESFNKLKSALCSPPILTRPNFSKQFTITCDASDITIGAVLSQEVDSMDML